jgi:hypothetical protein
MDAMTRHLPLPRRQSLRLGLLVAASLSLLAACAGLPQGGGPASDQTASDQAASGDPGAYSPG